MCREEKIKLLSLIIVFGFLSALVFHSTMGIYFGLDYPHNTFLFTRADRFMDFFNPLRGSFDRDPYNPERIHYIGGYLPFGYFVTYLFSRIRPWWISFSIFISTFLVFLNYFIAKVLYEKQKPSLGIRISIYFLFLLTYPVLFIVDRANFDIVVFILISLFALLYQKKNYTMALIMLAFATAMKGYPLVLYTIPLLDRRIKEIFLSSILLGLLETVSLALFKDGLIVEFSKMLTSFGSAYSIAFEHGSLIRFNSSFYTFLLFALKPLNPHLASNPFFSTSYTIVAIIGFAMITVIMYKKKFPFWQKLLVVILMMILFPQSSGDYRLVMLFPPLIMFLGLEQSTLIDRLLVILFGLLLIPKAYFILEADVNVGVLLNPVLLLLILIISTKNFSDVYKKASF